MYDRNSWSLILAYANSARINTAANPSKAKKSFTEAPLLVPFILMSKTRKQGAYTRAINMVRRLARRKLDCMFSSTDLKSGGRRLNCVY